MDITAQLELYLHEHTKYVIANAAIAGNLLAIDTKLATYVIFIFL